MRFRRRRKSWREKHSSLEETEQFIANMREYAAQDAANTARLYYRPYYNEPWHFDYITIPKDNTMTQYPMIIDKTYVPQVGDKIESTQGDTVLIGVVDRWGGPVGLQSDGNYHNPITAHDRNGMLLFINRDTGWSYRLLSRKPKSLVVGDIITGEQAFLLPAGSIITAQYKRTTAYDIVVLAGGLAGGRYRYHRVDRNFAWPRLDNEYKIKYINYIDCM